MRATATKQQLREAAEVLLAEKLQDITVVAAEKATSSIGESLGKILETEKTVSEEARELRNAVSAARNELSAGMAAKASADKVKAAFDEVWEELNNNSRLRTGIQGLLENQERRIADLEAAIADMPAAPEPEPPFDHAKAISDSMQAKEKAFSERLAASEAIFGQRIAKVIADAENRMQRMSDAISETNMELVKAADRIATAQSQQDKRIEELAAKFDALRDAIALVRGTA